LIDDLAELEDIENAPDIAAAREALADGEQPVPWEEAKARLDGIRGLDSSVSANLVARPPPLAPSATSARAPRRNVAPCLQPLAK